MHSVLLQNNLDLKLCPNCESVSQKDHGRRGCKICAVKWRILNRTPVMLLQLQIYLRLSMVLEIHITPFRLYSSNPRFCIGKKREECVPLLHDVLLVEIDNVLLRIRHHFIAPKWRNENAYAWESNRSCWMGIRFHHKTAKHVWWNWYGFWYLSVVVPTREEDTCRPIWKNRLTNTKQRDELLLKLKNIFISSTGTTIGDYSFSRCYSLSSLTFIDSIVSIGNEAFYYFFSSRKIVLNNTCKSILELFVEKFSHFVSFMMPMGMVYISTNPFLYCNFAQTHRIIR